MYCLQNERSLFVPRSPFEAAKSDVDNQSYRAGHIYNKMDYTDWKSILFLIEQGANGILYNV